MRYFEKFPEERNKWVEKWIASGNIWLIRSSLLIHMKRKEEVDFDYLFKTILQVCHTKEFFINKASGWALRQYAKFNPKEVLQFVEALHIPWKSISVLVSVSECLLNRQSNCSSAQIDMILPLNPMIAR